MQHLNEITAAELAQNGVVALADRPNDGVRYGSGMTAADLKAWFDRLGGLLAGRINQIVRLLDTAGAANYIRLYPDRDGVVSLGDLVTALESGVFASALLKLYPSAGGTVRTDLQSVVNGFAAALSTLSETVDGIRNVRWRGEWSAETAYLPRDLVRKWGSVYIAMTGNTACDPVSATSAWQLFCAKGNTGATGATGPAGAGFSVSKTYASIALMNADAANVASGAFVLIASTESDPDNAKLYVKGADGFSFLCDLSGAAGVTPVKGTDYFTAGDKAEMVSAVLAALPAAEGVGF